MVVRGSSRWFVVVVVCYHSSGQIAVDRRMRFWHVLI